MGKALLVQGKEVDLIGEGRRAVVSINYSNYNIALIILNNF